MTATETKRYIDKDEALLALRASVPELIALLRGVRNPNAHAVGDWSVRDVAAHLVDLFSNYRKLAEGHGSPVSSLDEIGDYNNSRVAAMAETDVGALADRIEEHSVTYLDVLSSIEGDPFVTWVDQQIPISTVMAIGISECLVHGYDIASAERRPWPLDPDKVGISMLGISPITVRYIDAERAAGLRACVDLRLRGQWQMYFVFDDGRLSIEEPSDRPVDVHISADPVAFMLVGYGRVSQWGPIARGAMLTWGRKPWLAFKFGTLLKSP